MLKSLLQQSLFCSPVGWYISVLLAAGGVGAIAPQAQAFSFVTDRSALNATDQLNWSGVGTVVGPITDLLPPADPSIFLPNTFVATSQAGQAVMVEIPSTELPGVLSPFVFQTTSGDGIETNFANGDYILFTGSALGPPPATGNPGPITLTFAEPVFGAGAQIAVGTVFDFTATLTAFDEQGQVLGSFSVPGMSSEALDNSALFLGAVDEQPRIAKLEFKASEPTSPIGINQLGLVTREANTTVPEPSMLLGMLTLVTLGFCRRRRTANRLS
ncbi:MAG: PEP-CTERM sorting domain-containing protein [Cyanobacteria bacterium P01_D01_bin.44]